jgi:ZIP family zinc transporter
LVLIAAAGMATAVGALPVVALRRLTHRAHDILLAFAAGIMLTVAVLDLGLHSAEHILTSPFVFLLALVAGAAAILVLIRAIRGLPLPMPFVRDSTSVEPGSALLLFLALAIHNVPEGLATGVGYGQGITALGNTIAVSIALQNIPEGLLVAVAVLAETGSRRASFGYAFLSGLVEPVVGVAALFFIAVSPEAIGPATALAAGAMIAVVVVQMIPESHRHGYHIPATLALGAGVAVAVLADVLIGFL